APIPSPKSTMKSLLGRSNVLLIIVRLVYVCLCAWAIVAFLRPTAGIPPQVEEHPFLAFFAVLVVTQLVVLVDLLIRTKRIEVISSIYFGLVIGLLLA